MTAKKGAVVHLHRLDPEEALERLNRITGLSFAQWPESLVQPAAETVVEAGDEAGDEAFAPAETDTLVRVGGS